MNETKDSRIYLDYAAATPASPAALAAMKPYWRDFFANAQSAHREGQNAREAVEGARKRIAKLLSVQPAEIVFTSGATEANSLAMLGVVRAYCKREKKATAVVALSPVAHASVSNMEKSFPGEVQLSELPVSASARIIPEDIAESIHKKTAVVSISQINSEVGTIQPVKKIVNIVKEVRGSGTYPLIHVDASQGVLESDVTPEMLGVDLLTLNPAKIFGPKGVGVLWVRSGTPLAAIMTAETSIVVGDYQKIRAGTPVTPLAVGAAQALEDAYKKRSDWHEHVQGLREFFLKRIAAAFPESVISGHKHHYAAHIASVTFNDTDHDFLAAKLDSQGIGVSTTSACQARKSTTPSVMKVLPGEENEAIRFSFSHRTRRADIEETIVILRDLLR